MDFTGTGVLITGAGRGIGRATALKFASHGAKVVVTDIVEANVKSVAEEINSTGGKALGLVLDVTDLASWKSVADRVHADFGTVSVVHNNAYIAILKPADETTPEEWDKQFAVNMGAIHKSLIVFVEDLRANKGAIVNTSSVHAKIGLFNYSAYAAAKGGIVSLSNQLAVQYGPDIRVNSVLPGPIMTAAWDGVPQSYIDSLSAMQPLRRVGQPEEVAAAVCFLASSEASFITGASLLVDGGFTVSHG